MDRREPVVGQLRRRAAVLGHPVSHSLSPVLHAAAYEALGLDWTYEAVDVVETGLTDFLAGLDDAWVGLSLTMPLKIEAARIADFVEPQAKLVGTVNTLVASGLGEYRQWVGANTDIHGVTAALREAGVSSCAQPVVIGAGATGTSALAALGALGGTHPRVVVRNRARAGGLMRAATKMGLQPRFLDLDSDAALDALAQADVVVSTVPAEAGVLLGERLRAAGLTTPGHLLDVVYSPLVTPLALAWADASGSTISGTRMLLHQAGEQVRLMTGQPAPLEAMETALNRVLTTS
ncbi:shikimate dehydrogenase [Demequina sp. TTPB684]|uniref:shikimate dehydrogenase n=1 Tax=unclassified Demequina TaxID=2620311 RepID=UPI00351D9539